MVVLHWFKGNKINKNFEKKQKIILDWNLWSIHTTLVQSKIQQGIVQKVIMRASYLKHGKKDQRNCKIEKDG